MTITFNAPTFTTLIPGDRSYVPEINDNFTAIVEAFTFLQSIADGAPLIKLSQLPALILGPDNLLLGNNSYQFTAGINSVTVSPGYAWLAAEKTVVQNPAPIVIQLNQAGTWYLTIDIGGRPSLALATAPPDDAFFSVVVTEVADLFEIGTPTQLVANFVSSSSPSGVLSATRPPLVVSKAQLYQVGYLFVAGLSSRDPRYAGFRFYTSYNGGVTYDVIPPQVTGLYPFTVQFLPVKVLDYGSLNWVDYYTLLGFPQVEIDKIPAAFKYRLVDLSYTWGNSVMGTVKTDWPDHGDPDTTNDLVLDMSESGETLLDPAIATSSPYPILGPTVSGALCFVEGGGPVGYESISYSDFANTGVDEVTILASAGIRRGYEALQYFGTPIASTPTSDHPPGSKFLYLPYWTLNPGWPIQRIVAPRYWVGGVYTDVRFPNVLCKLAPIDIDGNEQDLTTVPAYAINPLPLADTIPGTGFLSYVLEGQAIPSPFFGAITASTPSAIYWNRMFTITTPAPGSPVTYWVYFHDVHYIGDVFDAGFIAGRVNKPGSGYAVGNTGNILHPTAGPGVIARYQVTQVDANGGVLAFEVLTSGTFYDVSGHPLDYSGIGGIAPSYQTLAISGSGSGMVVDCTEAGYDPDKSGHPPAIECICTTDDTLIGARGYITVGKVVANSSGTGQAFFASNNITGGPIAPTPADFTLPNPLLCQFAPNKIFVGCNGSQQVPPFTNSALVYPYYNEP